jgi:hypothetical protein
MSQLIDRPSRVRSPVGLVVKNGWNSLSRNSPGTPAPLSRTLTSTPWPTSRVVTLSVGRVERLGHGRAFSIAMIAWAAKFCKSAICLSVNGRTCCR